MSFASKPSMSGNDTVTQEQEVQDVTVPNTVRDRDGLNMVL